MMFTKMLGESIHRQAVLQKITPAFDKVSATILSCKTPVQLEAAYRMLHNFFILYSKKVGEDTYSIQGEYLEAFEALKEIYEDKRKCFAD